MLDRNICADCRISVWGDMDTENEDSWLCPAVPARIAYRTDQPPKGCKRLLEQAMSAALKTVNVDKNS